MTGVAAARLHALRELRPRRAQVEAIGATGLEAAAGRRRERRRRRARDAGEPVDARSAQARDRVEQAPGVRVLRIAEDGPPRAFLDDAAGVHDDDPFRELRD